MVELVRSSMSIGTLNRKRWRAQLDLTSNSGLRLFLRPQRVRTLGAGRVRRSCSSPSGLEAGVRGSRSVASSTVPQA